MQHKKLFVAVAIDDGLWCCWPLIDVWDITENCEPLCSWWHFTFLVSVSAIHVYRHKMRYVCLHNLCTLSYYVELKYAFMFPIYHFSLPLFDYALVIVMPIWFLYYFSLKCVYCVIVAFWLKYIRFLLYFFLMKKKKLFFWLKYLFNIKIIVWCD